MRGPRNRLVAAQEPPQDLKRDAGLRGDEFRDFAVGLGTVFLVGLAVLAIVVISGRRRRGQSDAP